MAKKEKDVVEEAPVEAPAAPEAPATVSTAAPEKPAASSHPEVLRTGKKATYVIKCDSAAKSSPFEVQVEADSLREAFGIFLDKHVARMGAREPVEVRFVRWL